MATGETITGSLADSLPTVIASARQVREFKGVMAQLAEHQTLGKGTGLTWEEVAIEQQTAQAITETTDLQNPQQFVDTLLEITPTGVGIKTVITDRVARRISANSYAKLGGVAQNAIQRKKDEDGLAILDGATTSLGGAGTTLTTGHISAAARRITSNATEGAVSSIYCVLHGYQIRDIDNEFVAGVGTYNVEAGMTADVFRNHFRGKIGGAEVYEDGNLTIDSSSDAKGGVFAKEGLVLVEEQEIKTETERLPNIGGGATALYIYGWYAYGERNSEWVYEIYTDATAPTS